MPYKGRNAFLDTITPPEPGSELVGARLLPLDLIDPNPAQSRQVFDEAALVELATSIAEHGVLQPIVVRPAADRYQIVAGERRSRAARHAGLVEIPAIIRELTDEQAAYATAIENLQREDLDLEDEARQYQAILTLTGLSQRQLAAQLGVSHNYIADRILLLERADLLAAYRIGTLTLRQAIRQIRQGSGIRDNTLQGDSSVIPDDTKDDSRSADAVNTLSASSSVIPDDSPALSAAPIERATLDHRTGAAHGGTLVRTPWRDRPLRGFMDWVARVDVTTVPPQERPAALDQLAAAREWIARLEIQLAELGDARGE